MRAEVRRRKSQKSRSSGDTGKWNRVVFLAIPEPIRKHRHAILEAEFKILQPSFVRHR